MAKADSKLTARVKEAALNAGFVRAGVAEAKALEPEGAHLDAWLEAGFHGQMQWMKRSAEVRKDPRHPDMLESATSLIVLVAAYAPAELPQGPRPGRVAKYAQGADYHNVLRRRGRRVQRVLQEAGYAARLAVDSKPVYERAWAERAGVGFIGKNCCLIVPGVGSHVFLACLVTSAPLVPDQPMARRCGSCSLCLDACPTRAFSNPRTLDARRCISYLTIEHDGPIPPEHRRAIGPWLFGCDVCQDVCPYNQTARASDTMEAFHPSERWEGLELSAVLGMEEAAFASWSRGSPIKRAGFEGLRRNAALVLGNCGSRAHLPVLQRAAEGPGAAAEAARWAIGEIKRRDPVSPASRELREEDPPPDGSPS